MNRKIKKIKEEDGQAFCIKLLDEEEQPKKKRRFVL